MLANIGEDGIAQGLSRLWGRGALRAVDGADEQVGSCAADAVSPFGVVRQQG